MRHTMLRPLRLVSFNILEGFRPLQGGGAEHRHLDRQRAEAARSVVGDLDPDILVLNEALFCRTHAGATIDYAGLFGFPMRPQSFMTARGATPS